MLNKILLVLILLVTLVLGVMLNNISNKIASKNEEVMEIAAIEIKPQKAEVQLKMPAIWENLIDPTTKKIYLSYDERDLPTAQEIAMLLEADGTNSVYLTKTPRLPLKEDMESLNAIKNMDLFVILDSNNYQTNFYGAQEFGASNLLNKEVVVISSNPTAQEAVKYNSKVIEFKEESKQNLLQDFKIILNSSKTNIQ